jgi:hypothetical protein
MKINEVITEAVQLDPNDPEQAKLLARAQAQAGATTPAAAPATTQPAGRAAPIIPAATPAAPKPGLGTGLAKGLIKGLSALSYVTDPSGKTADIGRKGIASANQAQSDINKNIQTGAVARRQALGAQQQLTTSNINNYLSNWSKEFRAAPNKAPLVAELGAFLADRKGTPEFAQMAPIVKSVLKRSGLGPQQLAQYSATLGI